MLDDGVVVDNVVSCFDVVSIFCALSLSYRVVDISAWVYMCSNVRVAVAAVVVVDDCCLKFA
jgi:hypothetical protein